MMRLAIASAALVVLASSTEVDALTLKLKGPIIRRPYAAHGYPGIEYHQETDAYGRPIGAETGPYYNTWADRTWHNNHETMKGIDLMGLPLKHKQLDRQKQKEANIARVQKELTEKEWERLQLEWRRRELAKQQKWATEKAWAEERRRQERAAAAAAKWAAAVEWQRHAAAVQAQREAEARELAWQKEEYRRLHRQHLNWKEQQTINANPEWRWADEMLGRMSPEDKKMAAIYDIQVQYENLGHTITWQQAAQVYDEQAAAEKGMVNI